MDIGLAFPQMTVGFDRERVLGWCRAVDDGPFSSISAGERVAFDNLDGFTLGATAAAVTERVRVLFNVIVAPWHAPAMLAMQLASIDVVSGGRVEVAVGVGGRQQDYLALGSSYHGRFGRLDHSVAELRRLWAGGEATGGGQVGPPPVQPGGPRVLCSGTGPKSLARAVHWADGVTGFTIAADPAEAGANFRLAEAAWKEAGRTERPRLVTGSFAALGPDADTTLEAFGRRYLAVFGKQAAKGLSRRMPLHNERALGEFLRGLEAEGCDEVILVPASNNLDQVSRFAEVVGRYRADAAGRLSERPGRPPGP